MIVSDRWNTGKLRLPRRVKCLLRKRSHLSPRERRDLARWRRKVTATELALAC